MLSFYSPLLFGARQFAVLQKGSEWRLLLKTVFKKQATGVIGSSFFLSGNSLGKLSQPSSRPLPRRSRCFQLHRSFPEPGPHFQHPGESWGRGGGEVEKVGTAQLAAALGRGGLRLAPRLLPRTLGKKYCAWLFGRRWEPTYFLLALKMTATSTVCVIQRCSYVPTSVTTANQFQVECNALAVPARRSFFNREPKPFLMV